MARRIAVILSTFLLAFSILAISVLRVASVRYAFSGPVGGSGASPSPASPTNNKPIEINYELAYPGSILPDNPLWQIKALRDKLWLAFTFNSSKKAELLLLFADKRLAASNILFADGKPELAFSTLTKGEKYLESAEDITKANRKKGLDTREFDAKLASAALKHRQVIGGILTIAPEDAKPEIIKVLSYSDAVYGDCRNALMAAGAGVPENPFCGD
jgi:hypothetical protein